jgi:putative intracellular protease/amidase
VKVAILIYDGFTALDAIGPYEVLRSVPGWEVEFVGKTRGVVRTDSGVVGLSADRGMAEVTSTGIVLVPGGPGNRLLLEDRELLGWLREIDRTTTWTTSVCTGSLLLGAAGCWSGGAPPATGPTSSSCASTGPIRSAAATSKTAR